VGVRILHDPEQKAAVLYCSTSEWAFGPVISAAYFDVKPDRLFPPDEIAMAFLRWLQVDPRSFEDHKLESKWHDFVQVGIALCDQCEDRVVFKGECFCCDKCRQWWEQDKAIEAEEAHP
jgi:hypothetical protein